MQHNEKILNAKEIVEYRYKVIPEMALVGLKHFKPTGSLEELSKIQSHLEATKELMSYQKVKRVGSLSQATWHPELQKAEVNHQIGPYWSTMGHTITQKLYLFPEEALYLLEMGALEIMFNGTVLSVQRAYAVLLQPLTDISEECYRVYSQLSASGYKVVRHLQSNILTKYEKQLEIHRAGIKIKNPLKRDKSSDPEQCSQHALKKYKTRKLTELFPLSFSDDVENEFLQLRVFQSFEDRESSKLSINYDIYLSSDEKEFFRKACLQLPKFRIVVHRSADVMPDWKEFYRLARHFEDDVPIIHAIVFPEFISFYSIAPASTPVCD